MWWSLSTFARILSRIWVHITCLEIRKNRARPRDGRKNKPLRRRRKPCKTLGKWGFGPGEGGKKKINLTEDQKPSKTVGKTTFWGRTTKWQEKRQAHGRRLGTMETAGIPKKTLGKQRVPAVARQEKVWLACGPCGPLISGRGIFENSTFHVIWSVANILGRVKGTFDIPDLRPLPHLT